MATGDRLRGASQRTSNPTPEDDAPSILVLGDLEVDPRTLRVLSRGDAGRTTPKSMAVLLELARAPGHMRTRDELLARLWADSEPTGDALSHAVRELRRALGDDARDPRYIETVHGVGYRLLVPARFAAPADPAAETAAHDLQAAVAPSAPAAAEDTQPVRPPPIVVAAMAAILVLLAVLVAMLASGDWPVTPEAGQGPRLADGGLLTSEPGAEEFPRLSPSGSQVAYSVRATVGDRFDLYVQGMPHGRPVPLSATAEVDELMPAWSPDGRWIAYLRIEGDRCSIERMPSTGGPSVRLAACDRVIFGSLDWHAHGDWLVAALPSSRPGGEPRLHRIGMTGGPPVAIDYQAEGAGWDRDPAIAPDGRTIAFRRGVPPDYDLHVVTTTGGKARRLTRDGRVGEGVTWTADGRWLIFTRNHAGQQSLDAIDVATGTVRSLGMTGASRPHAVGEQLVFQRQRERVQLYELGLSPQQHDAVRVLAASTGSVRVVSASPDDRRLAYVSDRGGSEQLWVGDLVDDTRNVFPHPGGGRISSIDWDDRSAALLVVIGGSTDRAFRLDLSTGQYQPLGLERGLVRDLVHGATPDELFAIVRQDERSLVARLRRQADGSWLAQTSDVDATELTRLPGMPGVFSRTLMRPDEIVHVGPTLRARPIPMQSRIFGWAARDGAIWYISSVRRTEAQLRRLTLQTGEDVIVRSAPHAFPRRRAAMTVRASSVILGLMAENDTDIGAATIQTANAGPLREQAGAGGR